MQGELDRLLELSVCNGLPINLNKDEVISFCQGDYLYNAQHKLAKIELERVDHIRDLGVIMDKSLSCTDQMQVVVKKFFRKKKNENLWIHQEYIN